MHYQKLSMHIINNNISYDVYDYTPRMIKNSKGK